MFHQVINSCGSFWLKPYITKNNFSPATQIQSSTIYEFHSFVTLVKMSYWVSGFSYDGDSIAELFLVSPSEEEAWAQEWKQMVTWVKTHRTVDSLFVLKATNPDAFNVGTFSFSSEKRALAFIATLKSLTELPVDETNVKPIFDLLNSVNDVHCEFLCFRCENGPDST